MAKKVKAKKKTLNERYQEIVDCYKKRIEKCPDPLLEECKKYTDLKSKIKCAALSESREGRRHPHQRRLKKTALDDFAGKVGAKGKITKIKNATSFDGLLKVVESCKVKGVGELAIYDVALRLGYPKKQLLPKEIYLHAGARVGAKNLLGKDYVRGKGVLERTVFPKPFQELACWKLEGLLCICKDALKTGECKKDSAQCGCCC